ncbi:MAG: DUF3365 domain-containing protein [Rhodothermales bacterium]
MKYLLPFLLVIAAACDGSPPATDTLNEQQRLVVQAVHEVDSMRSARAASMDGGEVDFATFADVCPPVGRRAAELAQQHGWEFRQLATRNRNPANYPDDDALPVIDRFEDDPTLDSLWLDVNGGLRYFHRITVEESCLACHGAESELPDFVPERYPSDRAFGFEPGDLRGVYSVVIPDSLLGP